MKEQKETKLRLERLELSNRPTLYISSKLRRQIDYLHSKVNKNEWSGELITREEGTVNDLDSWKIFAEDIFLVDVGSPGYTSYEVDKAGFKAADIVQLYETYPTILEGELKNHHIHTHHNMSAFFSGTDWENLEERARVSNYFLMLIVNFDGKYCAKVAMVCNVTGKGKTQLTIVNNADDYPSISLAEDKDKQVLVVMDCNIECEELVVDKEFEDRYIAVTKAIEEQKEADKKKGSTYYPPAKKQDTGDWRQSPLWGDGYDSYNAYDEYDPKTQTWKDTEKDVHKKTIDSHFKKETKIHNMTEKQWKKYNEEVWEKKSAYALINAVIDNSHSMDFQSPIPRLLKMDKMFKTKRDREEYLIVFSFSIRDFFESVFYPKTDDDDYIELLFVAIEALNQYKDCTLIQGIIDICSDEIGRYQDDDDDDMTKMIIGNYKTDV